MALRFATFAAVLAACSQPAPPIPETDGRALQRILPDAAVIGRPDLTPSPTTPEANSLRIVHDPEVLQVYRSTRVQLEVDLPDDHRAASCVWSFADAEPDPDAPPTSPGACIVEHTFIGGAADERVSVVVTDGAWSKTLVKILPLERLPVSTRPVEPDAAGDLPTKPTGQGAFRLVVIADTADAPAERLNALARRIVAIDSDLVIHLGGHANDGESWNRLRESLSEGLRAANIPLLSAVSPSDLAFGPEVRRPLGTNGEQLDLQHAEQFPDRWTFSHQGVFFAFTSGADQTSASLDWLRDRLAEAQVYESRIVLSYLPLHPFGEHMPEGPGPHTIGPKFKVYELLLRARTTAFFSAGHHVYFKGRYGALPVVSVASPSTSGAHLLGNDTPQAASIVVMDIARGLPQRVFALVDAPDGSPFSALLDEAYLPETVEVYTR